MEEWTRKIDPFRTRRGFGACYGYVTMYIYTYILYIYTHKDEKAAFRVRGFRVVFAEFVGVRGTKHNTAEKKQICQYGALRQFQDAGGPTRQGL